MARFSRTIHIDATPAKVFALITDPSSIASLDAAIQSVRIEQAEGVPRAVHVTLVPSPAVSPIRIAAEVSAYEVDHLLVLRSPDAARGPRFGLRYLCAEAGGGTDLTCEVEIALGGLLGGLADGAIYRKIEQEAGGALAHVKRILEGAVEG